MNQRCKHRGGETDVEVKLRFLKIVDQREAELLPYQLIWSQWGAQSRLLSFAFSPALPPPSSSSPSADWVFGTHNLWWWWWWWGVQVLDSHIMLFNLRINLFFFSFFLWLLFLRRYTAFIFRFIICFGDTTRIGLHPLMLKKAHQFSPHFSSCLFKAPPPEDPVCSDWSAHTCLTYNNSRAAVLNQFFHDKLAVLYYANVLHGDVAWCHKVWN